MQARTHADTASNVAVVMLSNTYTHSHTHAITHTYTHEHTHTHTRTYTHARTHTHTHTHTQTRMHARTHARTHTPGCCVCGSAWLARKVCLLARSCCCWRCLARSSVSLASGLCSVCCGLLLQHIVLCTLRRRIEDVSYQAAA